MKRLVLVLLILYINIYLISCKLNHKFNNEELSIIDLNNLTDEVVSITKGGSFSISGKLEHGYIEINTKEIVRLILDDVNIHNPNGPAILVTDAKKVTLELRGINYLSDGKSDNELDAVIFTNDTIIIEGDGILNIIGSNEEGISSDDDIIINSGTIKIDAKDDGLNANDDITINGGYIFIKSNGDGIDSNGTININGGTVIALGSTKNNDGGLDATISYTITGGTVIATGKKIVPSNINSTQSSLYLYFDKIQTSGTIIHIEKDHSEILTFLSPADYKAFYFSSEKLVEGEVYDINLGGTSNGFSQDGLYLNGHYIKGDFNTTAISKSVWPSTN